MAPTERRRGNASMAPNHRADAWLTVFAKHVVHPEHSEKNGVATQPFRSEEPRMKLHRHAKTTPCFSARAGASSASRRLDLSSRGGRLRRERPNGGQVGHAVSPARESGAGGRIVAAARDVAYHPARPGQLHRAAPRTAWVAGVGDRGGPQLSRSTVGTWLRRLGLNDPPVAPPRPIQR